MSGENWQTTLIDRLTSVPMLIFYIIILGAVMHKLDPSILHSISSDLKGLFR